MSLGHFEMMIIGGHTVKMRERSDGKILAICDCGSNTVHNSLVQAELAVQSHHENDNNPQTKLQAEVDKTFAEPDYVDTGDLINVLHMALDMLRLYDIDVTIPTHYDEDDIPLNME